MSILLHKYYFYTEIFIKHVLSFKSKYRLLIIKRLIDSKSRSIWIVCLKDLDLFRRHNGV